MSANTPDAIRHETEDRMQKSIEALKREFATVRTGRATSAILETVKIDYYNSLMPVNQVASIGVPDAHTLEIKPWDASLLSEIEKAILKANLGLTPSNDGKLIRLKFPSLTEERRKELVKQVHKMAEDLRVELRAHRRKAMEAIKALKKESSMSEDDEKAFEARVQKLTDEYIGKVDQLTKAKEQELMEV